MNTFGKVFLILFSAGAAALIIHAVASNPENIERWARTQGERFTKARERFHKKQELRRAIHVSSEMEI